VPLTLHRFRPSQQGARFTVLTCLWSLFGVAVSWAGTGSNAPTWWKSELKGWVIHRYSDRHEIYGERRPLGQPRDACNGSITGPALVVGCRAGELVTFVHLLGPDVWADEHERVEVLLEFDGQPSEIAEARLTPRKGSVSSGFRFSRPDLVLRSMASGKKVSMRYQSYCWDGSTPASELTFDVQGLELVLSQLAGEGCHMKSAATPPEAPGSLPLNPPGSK
jgi:hypothetical protein